MKKARRALSLLLALLAVVSLLPQDAFAVSNETIIYQYLRTEMGLNNAAACGVLANVQCESDFNPNAVGDGGTSYGICQWHNERFQRLKQYRPKDWNTLTGQLKFLHYELENDKPGTWKYIRSVHDDATGAYQAGHYWCFHFEIPKNYPTVSVRRGTLARSTYWPKYAGKGTGTGDAPSIVGVSLPDSLHQGQGAELYGDVYSDSLISHVTVSLLDGDGREVVPPTEVTPYTTTYSVHTLSRYIPFDRLSPGDYTFLLTASNTSGSQSWTQDFTVLSAVSGKQAPASPLAALLRRCLPDAVTSQGQADVALKVTQAAGKVLGESI